MLLLEQPLPSTVLTNNTTSVCNVLQGSGGAAFGGPALMIVVDGVRKRRVKVNSNDSYQEVGVQFVSEKMIFWKRTMSAVSRRSGQTSEGWHAGRRRSRL